MPETETAVNALSAVHRCCVLAVVIWIAPVALASDEAPPAEAPLQPAEMASLEAEVVREWNAMHVEILPAGQHPHITQDRAIAFRKKVRRLFAASPSFTSLALFADAPGDDDSDEGVSAFEAEFTEMKSSLSRDFSKEPPYPPSFQGLAIAITDNVGGPRAPAGSLFARADDVAGWAHINEPLSVPMRAHGKLTAQYSVDFDGESVAALAPVYEVAKHLRKNVVVELSHNPAGDLEAAAPIYDINTAVLTAELPAYAVTRHGLIAGKFTRAGFFGGACSDRQPTAAELTFNDTVDDVVLAVFVTGIEINTKRARVQVDEQVFPTFGDSVNNGAITKRVTYSVDLNGDGVPELRGVSRRDTEPDSDIFRMRGPWGPVRKELAAAVDRADGGLVPVAGWYANDFDYFEANIGGRWLRLSTYHVVTCT